MSVPGLTRLRGVRGLAALIGATVALALAPAAVAGAAAPPAAHAAAASSARAAAAAASSPITASVTTIDGGVLGKGKNLVASVSVSNTSETAYPAGTVDLWVDPDPLATRSSLSSWLAATDAPDGTSTIGHAAVGALEPGTSTVVTVTVPAANVPFAASATQAVYGIGTTVTLPSATTAIARGSVAWNPGGAATKSSIGVVLPIISPSTGGGLISADDLTTYTAANGVLTRDLDGVAKHSTVAIGIDPMIIASIRVLGNAAPATASDWLARLAALPNDVFSLGFGDADLVGQIQSGIRTPLTPTSLSYALDPKNFTPSPTPVGEAPVTETPAPTGGTTETPTPTPTPTAGAGPVLPTLDELLSWTYTMQGIAWPGDATVVRSDLPALVTAGLTTTIVSGSNTNAPGMQSTPNAVLPFTGGKLAVSDSGLSDAIRDAASAPSDVAWNSAMSKVNAQLLLTSQESADSKNLLVAFDRAWPSSGTQLDRTLDALLGSAWSAPATLPSTLAAPSTSGLSLSDKPEGPARIASIKNLAEDEKAISGFSTVLDDPTTMTGRTRAELLTLLAVSWQDPRNDWAAAVVASRKATSATLDSITILPTENVNLVSAQGSIPFTVSNELKGEAVNIVLSASPSNSRLEIDEDATKHILPESRATVLVPVKAKLGNGQVVLSLRLFSPTGVEIGSPSFVTVDVHADWEGIGALIFGILLVLLFGFGIVRNILRRRKRGSDDVEATDAEAGADPDSAPDAGLPAAPDASPHSSAEKDSERG
ncbi:DUF6049 family protein [Leifsonia poae]|uniref:2-oxoglutarate dehydrogenase n=1 Tax=Leifsonia poae TaxID=110933 RepID=A0A9W6H976_9MICO|nr:DUF6049 family protein [Leifsonia poae]GLJ75828.1 hypothetical protein GCM10017584_14020 [Leifsonia poae]